MNATSIYKTPAGQQAVMNIYDTLLQNWPVPYQTLHLATRHGDTFVLACGEESAPPMVLLHGAGTNSAIWVGDVVEYSRHYRVYAVDLLGEPGKSAPNRPPWDSPAHAEWLEEVFNALNIDKAILLGVSQGGWIALEYTTQCPERVEKLILLCPGGVVPDKVSILWRVIPLMLLGRWGIRRMVRMLYAGQPIPQDVEDIFVLVTSNFKPRYGLLPVFSDEELGRLTMPTFLLGGAQDVFRDLEKIATRLRQFLPGLSVTILPDAGHALPDTTTEVMAFLAAGE